MARIIILSDIHANLSALDRVLTDIESRYVYDYIAILGDMVNYGMRPNEVIGRVRTLKKPILANLYGNHEKALFDGDTSHFSSERGARILEYTREHIDIETRAYLSENLSSEGYKEIVVETKAVLFVHGSLSDPYWGKMADDEMSDPKYAKYDYVISGHSHIPNLTEKFYADGERPEYRNKKRTVFLNPGSVGQPRNHNPRAQYLFIDTELEIFHFNSVKYDVEYEQSLYCGTAIDGFYMSRLTNGI